MLKFELAPFHNAETPNNPTVYIAAEHVTAVVPPNATEEMDRPTCKAVIWIMDGQLYVTEAPGMVAEMVSIEKRKAARGQ